MNIYIILYIDNNNINMNINMNININMMIKIIKMIKY